MIYTFLLDMKHVLFCLPDHVLNEPDTKEQKQVFSTMQKKKALDAACETELKNRFGESIIRDTGLGKINEIKPETVTFSTVRIFPDDAIKDIHVKVRYAIERKISKKKKIKKTHSIYTTDPLYMWCESSLYSPERIKDSIVDMFFAHTDLPKTWQNLKHALSQCVERFSIIQDSQGDLDTREIFLHREQAREVLRDHVELHSGMLENMNFICRNERQTKMLFPVHPFKDYTAGKRMLYDTTDENDFIYIVPRVSFRLDSVSPRDNIIYVGSATHCPAREHYFPRTVENELDLDDASWKDVVKKNMRVMSAIQDDIEEKNVFHHQTSLRRVSYTRPANNHHMLSFPLEHLFRSLSLDADSHPFMVWKSKQGLLYKLNKDALYPHGNIDERNLRVWTDQKTRDPSSQGQVEALVIKINLGRSFGTLTLYGTGSINVRAYFSIDDGIGLDNLDVLIDPMNIVFREINESLVSFFDNDVPLPYLSRDELEGSFSIENRPELETHTWFMPTSLTTGIQIRDMNDVKRALQRLTPYFVMVPNFAEKNENIISVAYKRTEGFHHPENIYAYIRMLRDGDPREHIEHLTTLFDLSPNQAIEMIQNQPDVSRKKFEFTLVQIIPTIASRFRVNIKNLSSQTHLARILRLLDGIFSARVHLRDDDDVPPRQRDVVIDVPRPDSPPQEAEEMNEETRQLLEEMFKEGDDDDASPEENEETEDAPPPPPPEQPVDVVQDTGSTFPVPPPVLVNEYNNEQDYKRRRTEFMNRDEGFEKNKNYTLTQLQAADPDLFNSKNEYSRKCQMTKGTAKQPTVVRPSELREIQRKYPGSVTNWLSYGSTDARARQNVYLCPDVWCPISRVAMTRLQFEENQHQCPNRSETPLAYYTSGYLNKQNERNARPFIGFTKNKKTSVCLPCCGIKVPEPKEDGKYNCGVPVLYRDDIRASQSGAPEKNVRGVDVTRELRNKAKDVEKTKYVLEDKYPLDAYRYGDVRLPLLRLLGKEDNPKTISQGTDSYYRKGNRPTHQPFLYCLLQIYRQMGVQLENEKEFVDALAQHLSVQDFLLMQNGLVFHTFLAQSINEYPRDLATFNAFKSWFLQQHDYMTSFHLKHVYERVLHAKQFDTSDQEMMREFCVFIAYDAFVRHLGNDNVVKTHDFFTGLVSRGLFDASKDFNLLVFEEKGDHIHYACPLGAPINASSFQKPTVILYQVDFYYELVYHVTMPTTQMHESVFAEHNMSLVRLLYSLMSSCSSSDDAADDIHEKIIQALGKKNIKARVLDYQLRVIGFLLHNDIFIPLHTGISSTQLPWQSDTRFVFIDTLYNIVDPAEHLEDVADTFRSLNQNMQEEYFGVETREDATAYMMISFPTRNPELTHCVIVNRNAFHRDRVKKVLRDMYWYRDLFVLTRTKSADARTDMMDLSRSIDKLQIALRNEIVDIVQEHPSLLRDINILRHPLNPMPTSMKKTMLYQDIQPYLKHRVRVKKDTENTFAKTFIDARCSDIKREQDCSQQCVWTEERPAKKQDRVKQKCKLSLPHALYYNLMAKCLDDILNPYFRLAYVSLKDRDKNEHRVVLFTPQDIEDGRLENIIQQSRDPYTSVLGYRKNTTDLQIELIDLRHLHMENNPSMMRVLRGTQDTAQYIPIPYGFKDVLKDFILVDREYKPLTVFQIFSTIYNTRQAQKGRSSENKMTAKKLRRQVVARALARMEAQGFEDVRQEIVKWGKSQFKGKTPDEYREFMLESGGYPGRYEVMIMSEFVDVNTILLVHKSKKTNDQNIMRLHKSDHDKLVILAERTCKNTKCHRYDVVQKNESVLFSRRDFPALFLNMIKNLDR